MEFLTFGPVVPPWLGWSCAPVVRAAFHAEGRAQPSPDSSTLGQVQREFEKEFLCGRVMGPAVWGQSAHLRGTDNRVNPLQGAR